MIDKDTISLEIMGTVEKVASQFSIDPHALWEMYQAVMESNLEQDLWDIANENIDELRKGKGL